MTVEFSGLTEALQKLQAVETGVSDKALRAGVNKAANILVREIKVRAPHGKEHALYTSIGRRNLKRSELLDGAEIGSLVGPIRKAREKVAGGQVKRLGQFYKAWFIEYGTKPHIIKARNGMLSFGGFFAKEVKHPGSRPYPFIGPAQDAAFPQMERAFEQGVDAFLTRIYGAG